MSQKIEPKEMFRIRDGLWHQGSFADNEAEMLAEAGKDPRSFGLRLFRNKKYQAAVPVLELAVKQFPEDFELRLSLGRLLSICSRWSDGEPHLAKAMEMKPRSYDAHFHYGEALLKIGHFAEAEEQFRIARRLRPLWRRAAAAVRSLISEQKKIPPHVNPPVSDPAAKLAFAIARREAVERAAEAAGIGEPNRAWRKSERGRKFAVRNMPLIGRGTKIFAIGSCFALEIRHELLRRGFDVFPKYSGVAFDPQTQILNSLPDRDNINHYNTFTIRQEFEQAFAETHFQPGDFWPVQGRGINRVMKRDTVWQDPYRKNIYAADQEGILQLSRQLDTCIRDGIMTADVYVMTLGLIETWKNTTNGLHACTYPGVGGGGGAAQTELHVAGFADNYENMRRVCELIFSRFPEKQIILTVSPVALESTFRDMDVVLANMESKCTLRAVAGQICREFKNVHYLPSFELFMYHDLFHDNGRHAAQDGVGVVVDLFSKCFIAPDAQTMR